MKDGLYVEILFGRFWFVYANAPVFETWLDCLRSARKAAVRHQTKARCVSRIGRHKRVRGYVLPDGSIINA